MLAAPEVYAHRAGENPDTDRQGCTGVIELAHDHAHGVIVGEPLGRRLARVAVLAADVAGAVENLAGLAEFLSWKGRLLAAVGAIFHGMGQLRKASRSW